MLCINTFIYFYIFEQICLHCKNIDDWYILIIEHPICYPNTLNLVHLPVGKAFFLTTWLNWLTVLYYSVDFCIYFVWWLSNGFLSLHTTCSRLPRSSPPRLAFSALFQKQPCLPNRPHKTVLGYRIIAVTGVSLPIPAKKKKKVLDFHESPKASFVSKAPLRTDLGCTVHALLLTLDTIYNLLKDKPYGLDQVFKCQQ